jgi:hypothetical protein
VTVVKSHIKKANPGRVAVVVVKSSGGGDEIQLN